METPFSIWNFLPIAFVMYRIFTCSFRTDSKFPSIYLHYMIRPIQMKSYVVLTKKSWFKIYYEFIMRTPSHSYIFRLITDSWHQPSIFSFLFIFAFSAFSFQFHFLYPLSCFHLLGMFSSPITNLTLINAAKVWRWQHSVCPLPPVSKASKEISIQPVYFCQYN